MRLLLLHNPTAGSEDHTVEELVDLIRRAGHDVACELTDSDALAGELTRGTYEGVAVAGGDGTVGKAACVVSDFGIPLAILPLGTANNIAHTLGMKVEPEVLVRSWDDSEIIEFDLGAVVVEGKSAKFAEAVGVGAFPEVMRETEQQPTPKAPERTLERDLRVFASVLERMPAQPYTLLVDGEDRSGKYLVVEVLNIPFIGPNIPLGVQTDPHDGMLDLVLVRESERESFIQLVRRLATGEGPETAFTSRPARHVAVTFGELHYHVDGSLLATPVPAGGRTHLEVSVTPNALKVLRPRLGR